MAYKELEQVKGIVSSEHWRHHHREFDVSPIKTGYSLSHEDYDDKNIGVRKRRHPRDFKIKAAEFYENLNSENYLDYVQSMERIFGLKEYNVEKAFKLAILELKGYVSLWHEKLKRNIAREAIVQDQDMV